eukprot:m.80637 g.80637  ORF g.80637 m.80637 type:complete len:870 (+) comp12773_c0_seq1:73-2682(+)
MNKKQQSERYNNSLRANMFVALALAFAVTVAGETNVAIVASRESKEERQAVQEVRRYLYQRIGTIITDTAVYSVEQSEGKQHCQHRFYILQCSHPLLHSWMQVANQTVDHAIHKKQREAHTSCLNEPYWDVAICGNSAQGTLYSAYTFAEKVLGVRFYPHGDVVPSQKMFLTNVFENIDEINPITATPAFAVRGANTWGTWTEGFDWWTTDNWRGFITQLSKMKMNFIGMHSYPEGCGSNSPEPTVWIGNTSQLNPTGGLVVDGYAASYTTTLKKAASYVPKPTSNYSSGGSLAFPDDCCCGVQQGNPSRCPIPLTSGDGAAVLNDQAAIMANAFIWAKDHGVKTGLGTETPVPQAKATLTPSGSFTPDSVARTSAIYEGIFKHLNSTLGNTLNYYWFWTPEGYEWSHPTHDSTQWRLAIGDMLTAYGVWKNQSWSFDLATAGWTLGPMDNTSYLDTVLPTDFKALSGLVARVGRNADDPGYANVTRHPTWIMPWMESDDALGWVELWVNRTLEQANNAAPSVSGLIGLQWRTQEVMAQFSALAQRGWNTTLTSREFWIDFARVNFGDEIALEAASIFENIDGDAQSVDGNNLPLFTSCCPGAIKAGNKELWSVYSKQFEFVDQLSALRSRVNGTANLGRLDHWLHTFRYFRSGGQLSCLLTNYTTAFNSAMKITNPTDRKQALSEHVVPIRQAMVDVWEMLMMEQLQAINTRGAMGTIQNMEAITKPILLDNPGTALSAALGGSPVSQPNHTYKGQNRVFVPNVRTNIAVGEEFRVEGVVFSAVPPQSVNIYFRSVTTQDPLWHSEEFELVTRGRGVYSVYTGNGVAGDIFEYFVAANFSDGSQATFPPGSFSSANGRDGDTITVVVV